MKMERNGYEAAVLDVNEAAAYLCLRRSFIPICRRRRYKNNASMQQADISMVTTDAILVLQASYTALVTVFGVLYGSI
jgi:hypothetical protein